MVGGSGGEGVGGPDPVSPFLCVREGHWLLRGWLPPPESPCMEHGQNGRRGICGQGAVLD